MNAGDGLPNSKWIPLEKIAQKSATREVTYGRVVFKGYCRCNIHIQGFAEKMHSLLKGLNIFPV